MKFRPSGIRRLIAVLILLFVGSFAYALEQMNNASFTSSISGWTAPAPTIGRLTDIWSGLSDTGAPVPSPFNISTGFAEPESLVPR